MDKSRDQHGSQEGPALNGPDYVSLLIEWDQPENENEMMADSVDEIEDELTNREIRHWDIVDEASDESFPASDPPAWGSAHAAPSQSTASVLEFEVEAIEPEHAGWFRRHLREIAISLAALGAIFGIRQLRRRHA